MSSIVWVPGREGDVVSDNIRASKAKHSRPRFTIRTYPGDCCKFPSGDSMYYVFCRVSKTAWICNSLSKAKRFCTKLLSDPRIVENRLKLIAAVKACHRHEFPVGEFGDGNDMYSYDSL